MYDDFDLTTMSSNGQTLASFTSRAKMYASTGFVSFMISISSFKTFAVFTSRAYFLINVAF